MDCFLGSIFPWAITYTPRGFAPCWGQTIPISQNEALFSLMGTIWGGDGRNQFGVPDLCGRAPIGSGQSPGSSDYDRGEMDGMETTTITANKLPLHTHQASFGPNTTQATVTVPEQPATGSLNATVITEIVGGDTTAQDPVAGGSYYLTGVKGSSVGPVTTTAPTSTTKAALVGTSVTTTCSADFVPHTPAFAQSYTALSGGAVTITAAEGKQNPIATRSPYTVVQYMICIQGLYPTRN